MPQDPAGRASYRQPDWISRIAAWCTSTGQSWLKVTGFVIVGLFFFIAVPAWVILDFLGIKPTVFDRAATLLVRAGAWYWLLCVGVFGSLIAWEIIRKIPQGASHLCRILTVRRERETMNREVLEWSITAFPIVAIIIGMNVIKMICNQLFSLARATDVTRPSVLLMTGYYTSVALLSALMIALTYHLWRWLYAFRLPWLSDRNSASNSEQVKSEVLAVHPTAVYWRMDVRNPSPEGRRFSKYLKLLDLDHGYMDLSGASEEERLEYAEHCKRQSERPADETWHFVALSNSVSRVHETRGHPPDWGLNELTVFEAQNASLGYSFISEEHAWREAWGKVKFSEDETKMMAVTLMIVAALGSAIYLFGIERQ